MAWNQKQSSWDQPQQGGWGDQQNAWDQQGSWDQNQKQGGWNQKQSGWDQPQQQQGWGHQQQQGWGQPQQGGHGGWSNPFGSSQNQGGPNIFNPSDPMSNLVKNTVKDLALNAGGQFYSQAYNKAWVFNSYVRTFFNVTNNYVKRKLLYIIAPFTKLTEGEHYHGAVEFTDIVQQDTHHKNIATPDLYIPLMAIITYVLLLCLIQGSENEFHPKKIGSYTTNALVGILLELGLVKFLLFLTNIKTLSTLDLLSYHNYKFVGICFSLLTRMVSLGVLAYVIRIYFSIAAAVFMYKTLRSHFQTASVTVNTNIGLGNLKKDTMLIVLSALQVFTFWIILFVSL